MLVSAAGSWPVDAGGYLLEAGQWSADFAQAAARADGIELTPAHWEVIEFLRQYHSDYGDSPPMRVLVKALARQWGAEKADSRRLYQLFPQGPAKQACRYAGLPKPVSCI